MPALIVHGGAGDLEPGRHAEAAAGCARALDVGLAALAAGASAVDAVCAAVRVLEDDPLFNAGTGSALTRVGTVECDAAVMDGATAGIGGVAAMANCGRAVAVARAVLDDGEHVLLCGDGAWTFAVERGFRPDDPDALVTERARRRLEVERQRRVGGGGRAPAGGQAGRRPGGGTVGACAIDAAGHVAAATSTGGAAFKRPGRIGDSPLAGCGTYALDQGGAASATGPGEAIVRVTMTRGCVDAMQRGATATEAAWAALDELDRVTGESAGVICCDRTGRVGAAVSAATMPYAAGRLSAAGDPVTVSGVRLERSGEGSLLVAGA